MIVQEKINWWNLDSKLKLKLKNHPDSIKRRGNFTSIKRLLQQEHRTKLNQEILGIKRQMTGSESIPIKFPIQLNNIHYAKLYGLMISEGSHRTEFALNVPEDFFHKLFRTSISNLISEKVTNLINTDYNK